MTTPTITHPTPAGPAPADPSAPLPLPRGPALANRFMLAPLTNLQSRIDGSLSASEFRWLTMRGRGGFGLVMTCASHVLPEGQGFPAQLGIWSDHHIPGLRRLAEALRRTGSVSAVQLHHAGIRSPKELIGRQPAGAYDDAGTGGRAMTTAEVEQAIEAFIRGAERADEAGFDGVELHAAHSYLICQFLDTTNQRSDGYGGSFANRRRFLDAILAGMRQRTRPDFQLGVRLSPERHNIDTAEAIELAGSLMASGAVDYIDMSLWSCFKEPIDPRYAGTRLIDLFANLPRGAARLGVAGNILSGEDVRNCLEAGADFVLVGRGGILHHDFPQQVASDPAFASAPRPVSRDYLRGQGLSDTFVDYMANWKGFVTG